MCLDDIAADPHAVNEAKKALLSQSSKLEQRLRAHVAYVEGTVDDLTAVSEGSGEVEQFSPGVGELVEDLLNNSKEVFAGLTSAAETLLQKIERAQDREDDEVELSGVWTCLAEMVCPSLSALKALGDEASSLRHDLEARVDALEGAAARPKPLVAQDQLQSAIDAARDLSDVAESMVSLAEMSWLLKQMFSKLAYDMFPHSSMDATEQTETTKLAKKLFDVSEGAARAVQELGSFMGSKGSWPAHLTDSQRQHARTHAVLFDNAMRDLIDISTEAFSELTSQSDKAASSEVLDVVRTQTIPLIMQQVMAAFKPKNVTRSRRIIKRMWPIVSPSLDGLATLAAANQSDSSGDYGEMMERLEGLAASPFPPSSKRSKETKSNRGRVVRLATDSEAARRPTTEESVRFAVEVQTQEYPIDPGHHLRRPRNSKESSHGRKAAPPSSRRKGSSAKASTENIARHPASSDKTGHSGSGVKGVRNPASGGGAPDTRGAKGDAKRTAPISVSRKARREGAAKKSKGAGFGDKVRRPFMDRGKGH